MNPYWDTHFFSFFAVLCKRLALLLTGNPIEIASDEIQLAVLSAVAISCGLISPFVILQRMTMLANALSHTLLLGLSLSALFTASLWGGSLFDLPTLLIGAFLAAFLTAFCTEILSRFFRLQTDASIGLVFTTLFSLGVLIVNLYLRDVHLGVEAVMGNADALRLDDLFFPFILIALNGFLAMMFFKQFQLASFDANLAQTLGVKVGRFRFLLLFLTAATCIGAFRAVGVLLVLGFLTGPYLTARLFSNRLTHLLFLTPLAAVAAAVIGVALSRHLLTMHDLPLSTGGIVSVVIGGVYAAAWFFRAIRCRWMRWVHQLYSNRISPR